MIRSRNDRPRLVFGGMPGLALLILSALFVSAFSSCGTAPEQPGEIPGLSSDAVDPGTLAPVESTEVMSDETGTGLASSEGSSEETSAPDSAVSDTAPADTTAPETTVPETTVPETTVPETTVPETTVPETTLPETTVPVTTVPVTTVPETTAQVTDPPVTTASSTSVSQSLGINPDTIYFLPKGGYFIYKNSAWVTASYTSYQETIAKKYRQVAEKYAEVFPGTRVHVMLAPCSAVMLADDEYAMTKTANQVEILSKVEALYADSPVTFVNISDKLYEHRDEYLYLRTDHHWNSLGAYYAYVKFIEGTGMTPSPISAYNKSYVRDRYLGSIYSYNYEYSYMAAALKDFRDIIESYESRKPCTMEVRNKYGNVTGRYSFAIFNTVSHSGGIASFAAGDQPFVHINVPENPQNLNILILKDSYADQFAPFLIENYGNIYIVDPRYNSGFKPLDYFKDINLSDILFLNNLQVGNSEYWQSAYGTMIGFKAK